MNLLLKLLHLITTAILSSEMQFIVLVCKLTTLKMQEILKINMYTVLFYALLSEPGTLYSELGWVERG